MRTLPMPHGPVCNPSARIERVAIGDGHYAVVIDDALTEPELWLEWATLASFATPAHYPYPGIVAELPALLDGACRAQFDSQVRGLLGGRRTQDGNLRYSVVTTPAHELRPIQWQCHRDRIAADPSRILFAASVLYLFRDTTLGGTSFYRSRLSSADADRMVADSQTLTAEDFSRRYGLSAGYMNGSNDYFERTVSVPAAWNRLICYDGSLFHSADIDATKPLSADPRHGRLTVNAFYTCTRSLA